MQTRSGSGGGTGTLAAALFVATATCALLAERAEATALVIDVVGFRLPHPSFWHRDNWVPQQAPAPGDSVQLWGDRSPNNTLYLGEVGSEPAQTGQIQRLYVADSSNGWTLNWGAQTPGFPAGGLRFSQDDPADFGVGLRLGSSLSAPTGERIELTMIDAQNASTDAFNIALGFGSPSRQPAGANEANALTLRASDPAFAAPTYRLHADQVRLEGDFSEVHIQPNAVLSANRMAALDNRGSQLDVNGGSLIATDVELEMRGAGNVPLLVRNGGTAQLGQLVLRTAFVGNAAMARFENGLGMLGNVELHTFDRSSAALEVIGGTAAVDIDTLWANANDGPIALRVLNGASLTLNPNSIGALTADPGPSGTGAVSVLVDGAGSVLTGWFSGNASYDFSNGGRCNGCTLNVFTGGAARFLSGSVFDGGSLVSAADAEFRGSSIIAGATLVANEGATFVIEDTTQAQLGDLSALGSVVSGVPTHVRVTASNPGAGTAVSARTVHLDSTFDLILGTKAGGEAVGVAPARLELRNGTRFHIGPNPVQFSQSPMLAIGASGELTLDPTSAVFIGDGITTPTYSAGAIVLDNGGNLYGTGTINGAGFAAGTHPIVFNTGGNLNPGFSPGTLTIDGEYVQQDGFLTLEIGGVNAGEFDVLDAMQGASFLGGTLRFERLNNFAGVLGAQLDFFAGRAVSFDPSLLIEDNTGFGLAFDFTSGIATITQLAVPEPPIAALLAAGCVGLGWIGRRRA